MNRDKVIPNSKARLAGLRSVQSRYLVVNDTAQKENKYWPIWRVFFSSLQIRAKQNEP